MAVGTYTRRPATITAARYDDLGQICADLHAMHATVRRDPALRIYDWDTFGWRVVRRGDWVVRDQRGVCRPVDNATFQTNYQPEG